MRIINYIPEPSPSSGSLVTNVQDKLISNYLGLGNEYIEFKHVMDPFPTPVLITTPDGHIVYANSAWERLTGYTCPEVMGKNPHILHSNKTPRRVFTHMWKKLQAGLTYNTEDIIDTRKDGTEYQINSIIFPIRHDDKNLFYVQIEQDITNRKKLEDLKKEFLSAATHELKTPITTLKLLIQSQIKRLMGNEIKEINRRELELIDRELTRLTHIIDELSDVSRIETGKLHMEMKSINIAVTITDVVHQMNTIANTHTIIVRNKLSVNVSADEERIKQVLINLIKNALKFSYPESDIEIVTSITGTQCIVAVRNKGEGIPKDKQALVFKRFYQIHGSRNSGLGLGLYLSKKIIERHKGKIWIESERGKRTTVYFSLPIAQKNKLKGGEERWH